MDILKRRNKDEDKLMLVDMLNDVVTNKNRLGTPLFNKIADLIPLVAVEIVLYNTKGEIFLTYRDDENFTGWHFPGRILRFGNTFEDELLKVLEYEVGITNVDYRFLLPRNYSHSRGQEVSIVFLGLCDSSEMGKGSWFTSLPDDTLPQYKELYKEVQNCLR